MLIDQLTLAEIGWDEFFMGLNILRWWHLNQAKGKVLEIGNTKLEQKVLKCNIIMYVIECL